MASSYRASSTRQDRYTNPRSDHSERDCETELFQNLHSENQGSLPYNYSDMVDSKVSNQSNPLYSGRQSGFSAIKPNIFASDDGNEFAPSINSKVSKSEIRKQRKRENSNNRRISQKATFENTAKEKGIDLKSLQFSEAEILDHAVSSGRRFHSLDVLTGADLQSAKNKNSALMNLAKQDLTKMALGL